MGETQEARRGGEDREGEGGDDRRVLEDVKVVQLGRAIVVPARVAPPVTVHVGAQPPPVVETLPVHEGRRSPARTQTGEGKASDATATVSDGLSWFCHRRLVGSSGGGM